MQTQTVIFLGPQGCGKGTQVDHLVKHLLHIDGEKPIVHLQTGAGFRALKDSDTFMAKRIIEIIESGQLVPDFITTAVVVNEFKEKVKEDTHLLLDGFPRNVTQAKFLDELLQFYSRDQLSVVHLATPEEVVRQRMLGRGRSDDTEESINERLALYRAQTEPLISFYEARLNTNLVTVDGSKTIGEVSSAIIDGLHL